VDSRLDRVTRVVRAATAIGLLASSHTGLRAV